MFLSVCSVYDSKEQRFIHEEEDNGLITSLGIKADLDKNFSIWSRFALKV